MPAWKKVIMSGSNAVVATLTADTSVTAPSFIGTASWAYSASNAVSASWAPGGSLVEGQLYNITASWAVSASHFLGQTYATFTQAAPDVTWSFTHNLNFRYPVITVWNSTDEVVIPEKIYSPNTATTYIYFPVSMSGKASATVGSILPTSNATASYAFNSLTASYAVSAAYAPPTAPAPAGPASSIQFNDDGSISGSIHFRYVKSTESVYLSGSLTVTSSVIAPSFVGTASFAVSASSALSSSVAISASYATFAPLVFSIGGTIADLANGVSVTGSFFSWRAPFSCSLQGIYAKRSGTGNSEVNARRSGSTGYSAHTGSNLVLESENNYYSPLTIENTSYGSGQSLEFIISGSGASQVFIQADFIRLG